jgi:RNA polymerase sigma-70 factor (ECF subfamily)
MSEGTVEEFELRTLMARYQSADAAAQDELVRRLSPPILRYFSASSFGASRIGREDAEDLLQECWLRMHRSRHTYRASEPVMPWIYAIARHTRLDAYRKRRRRESRELTVETLPETVQEQGPNQSVDQQSDQQSIEHLIADLPESQREVIVMLKVTGMSLEEVAGATSSTVGAVKQKAHRAYETLRRALERNRGNAR